MAAERRVSPLSGGAQLLPDHTLAEVDRGAVPEPDVVVVPAVTDPADAKEARLRDWIVERHRKGAHVLGVCAGRSCWRPPACWTAGTRPPSGPTSAP
ncbi:hypothetical protein [Streptomyces sp. NPDC102437]|uniref:hypothetical protein n=1 Tax=Streptomyces sp. NPDC102437 TaxID=3366175 RepID=UPI0038023551